ncbi:MAG: hypothetical protein ABI704_08430 [Kofleriaceae bacterium]
MVELVLQQSGRIEGVVEGRRARHTVVCAKRSDEPEQARRQFVGEIGEFCFDDVPPGEYQVALLVPKTVHAPSVRVTVVDGQAPTVKLTMVTSGVELTVTVPPGRGMELVLASADSSTSEPEHMKPKIIMVEPRITMGGVPTRPWTGKESITFEYLQPGSYRASIDGETWTPIVVASSPQHQCFEISASE